MLGKLVATGNKDADAYLRIARDIHVLTVAAEKAAELAGTDRPNAAVQWPPSATDGNPLGYEPAAWVAAIAPDVIDGAWERAQRHYEAVRDERTAALAGLHVGRLWDPLFTLDT
jgi:hypothetical protein